MSPSLSVDDLLHATKVLRYREALVLVDIHMEAQNEMEFDELVELIENLAYASGQWESWEPLVDEALEIGTKRWANRTPLTAVTSVQVCEVIRLAAMALVVKRLLDPEELAQAIEPLKSFLD